MKSPRLLLAPVSAFLLFAAPILAPASHAQEPDIRAQVQTWEAALTAASPLNNPAAMIAQANATNPTPSNRGDLLGAVAAAAATKARLYQWYGTPAYLTDAKTYFMAIVNGFTTTADVSFFAPYTMMAAYEILDANGQFTPAERDQVRLFTAGRFKTAAVENHPDNINNALFTRAAGLRKASNLIPTAADTATWNTFANNFWAQFISLEDVAENANTYLGISAAYAWLLADELGQAPAMATANIQQFHRRLRDLVTPAGAMPAYGDSFNVNRFVITPSPLTTVPNNLWPVRAEWTYYVAALERAATVFGDASLRAAARAIYDSGVAREPMTDGYRNMQSIYVLSLADTWRTTALTPVAAALGTQIITKRYRDSFTSTPYQAIDKLILSPSRASGQPYAMIDTFPPAGWHSHVNQQGAIGYFQKDNIPLLTALDGNSRGPDSISTLLLRPGAAADFPTPAANYPINTWTTIFLPLASVRSIGPAGFRDYVKLLLRVAVKASYDTTLTVDNLRLVGPAGSLTVDDFETTTGWSGGTSLTTVAGSTAGSNGMAVYINNTSAVSSAYFIGKNFTPTTVDLSQYKYLAIDWKISNTPDSARPFIFRVDTIPGGNTLLTDYLTQELQLGPVKSAAPYAIAGAGAHYADLRFNEYFTSATSTTRRIAMDARGAMIVRDELIPGAGSTALNASADGQNAGPIWLLGATGTPETGTRWVDSVRDPLDTQAGPITDLFVYMNSPATPTVAVQTLTNSNSPRINGRIAYARQTLTGGAPVRFTSVLIPHDPAISGATVSAGLTVTETGQGTPGLNGALGYTRATYTLAGTTYQLMQNVLWDSAAASATEFGDWDGPLAISARSTDTTLRTTATTSYSSTAFSSDAADSLVEHRYGDVSSFSATGVQNLTVAGQTLVATTAKLDAAELDYSTPIPAPATGTLSTAAANTVTLFSPDPAYTARVNGVTITSTANAAAHTRQFAIAAGSDQRFALADPALALHWSLDEVGTTAALDYTSLRDAALLNGATLVSGGRTGGALALDGVDDVARYQGPTGITGYPFTLSTWVKTTAATSDMTALALLKSTSDSVHWEIGVKNGLARIIARNTTKFETLSTANVADGAWHQLTGVFPSATSRTLYVDGVLVATQTDNVPFDSSVNRVAAGRLDRANPAAPFNGALDDVRLYSRALAPTEIIFPVIHWKFNETAGTTASSSALALNGTLLNGASFAPTAGRYGGAVTLDGVDDLVRADGVSLTTYPFTLAVWVKTSNTTSDMTALALLKSGVDSVHWEIGVKAGIPRLIARNTTKLETLGTVSVADGQWHQIVGIFTSPTSRSLYVDGSLVASATTSVPFDPTVNRLAAGRLDRLSPVASFAGSLDDARLIRGAVLPAQLRAP